MLNCGYGVYHWHLHGHFDGGKLYDEYIDEYGCQTRVDLCIK